MTLKLNTINKIIEHIKTAEIKNVEINDEYLELFINALHPFYKYFIRNKENCFLPPYKKIIKSLNLSRTSEIYFQNVENILNQFNDFVESKGTYECFYTFKKLNKIIKKSHSVIKKMYKIFDLEQNTEIPSFNPVNYYSEYIIDDMEVIVSAKNLIIELKKLSKKIITFIKMNNLFGDSYKFEEQNIINKFEEQNIIIKKRLIEKIKNQTALTKKMVEKSFIIDFFSDGAAELEEMSLCLLKGINILCNISKKEINKKYIYNDLVYSDLNILLENELKSRYNFLNDDLIVEYFTKFTEQEIQEKYRLLKKIKPTKEMGYDYRFFATTEGEEKLFNLIGLYGIKESVKKIKAYALSNKDSIDNLNLHMAFYGNPGTGKTEVARTIGTILAEAGVLAIGHVVEVSRKDLVGQYVGETSHLTARWVMAAMGGVLFIDEAYSIVKKEAGFDYGDEAISTLLKMMEDYRGKFCVIFAGYKNELEEMISTNPGLKSRIQFHLNFPNYSRDDLSDILDMMLKGTSYIIKEDVKEFILDVLEMLKKDPNFANAREVRNLIEQVIMNLNLRDFKSKEILLCDVEKYINDSNIKLTRTKKNQEILTGDEELEELIGLANIKNTIRKIRAFAKKSEEQGNLNIHMCFTGNPGTGKTEVARIISRILYDSGILNESKLVETNANGLIGTYVGETGPKTEKLVKSALNGVLFIDEAYSLCQENHNSSYGKEAIATLLKEMEDRRGNLCVILAGYKNEMNDLLNLNPGFNSRIQFHLDFQDYSNEELRLIAFKMLTKQKYVIDEEALDLVIKIVDLERNKQSFANARTLRNVIDKVILNQVFRTENTIDDNKIIIEDVYEYINENNIEMPNYKKTDNLIDTKSLIEEYEKFDTSIIDVNYIEQAVISLSGNDSEGTGFIISKEGLCLTCNHCIKNAGIGQQAKIIFNTGRKKIKTYSDFKVLLQDESNDIAVIQLLEVDNEYDFLPLELPEYQYKTLNKILMAGYPFGGETFTNISVIEGRIASVNEFNGRNVVFCDMFGKPGNSGSPVIDNDTKKIIGMFFGGISQNGEMIKCFVTISDIWNILKR